MSTEMIDFLSGDGRRCIAVLYAYLDESGTHNGASVLCVAGYVGNRKQWLSFEKAWNSNFKDSEVAIFHAVDSNCDRLRPSLASAIDKGKFMGMICSVSPSVFNNHASIKLKSQLGNAYANCAITCAYGICKWAYKKKLDPVTFVYEMGQPNADFVVRALKALAIHKDPEINIAHIGLGRKNDFPALATADFLSHVYGNDNKNDIDWYNYLVRDSNILHTELNSEKLIKMSDILEDHYVSERRIKELKRIMRFKENYAIRSLTY